jgi:hypothetical protein
VLLAVDARRMCEYTSPLLVVEITHSAPSTSSLSYPTLASLSGARMRDAGNSITASPQVKTRSETSGKGKDELTATLASLRNAIAGPEGASRLFV